MYYFLLVFVLLNKIQAEPRLLSTTGTCESPFGKHDHFPRRTYSTSLGNYELFINLCDDVADRYCGHNAKVCIKTKENGSVVLTGNRFDKNDSDNSLSVNILSSFLCKEGSVSVKFACSYDLIEQPKLSKFGNCKFEIQLFDPRTSCSLPCTTKIDNNIINFMPLSKVYRGQTESFNYSLGLCTESNEDCRNGETTSCVTMKNGEYKPLSEGIQVIKYDVLKNNIEATGHYHVGKKAYKLIINLKCNWDKKTPELSYLKIPIQGKKFNFTLQSSYGCIKHPSLCVINDKYNVYNFTSLSRPNYWTVTHPGGSIFFNICGKLTLPDGKGCSDYAQVCEKNATGFINRGRLQVTKPMSEEFHMIFTDGDICNNKSERYETKIRFKCGPDSEPRFNKTEDCVTILDWTTTAACPKQDESKCDHTPSPNSYQNCTFEENNLLYDFRSLVRKPENGYVIKNAQVPNVEFRLNLCEMVTDPDVPCLKDSMTTMKYLDKFNLIKRVVSLGKFKNFKTLSYNVSVIQTYSGEWCPDFYGYYEAIISLECSAEEEGPKYTHQSGCKVHFQWKTPAACPTKIKTGQCIIEDNFSDKRFNLTDLKDKSLRVNVSDVSYIFDICDSNTFDCSQQKNCEYVHLRNLITKDNKHYLEFNLSRNCNGDGDFNRTLMELTCGKFTLNDHFIYKSMDDCVLKLELQSTLICSKEDLSYDLSNHVHNKTTSKTVLPTYKRNCSVVNNSTGYILNIDKLNLNISSPNCPKLGFKRQYGITELLFMTDNLCYQSQNWTYLVKLQCPTDIHQDTKVGNACQRDVIREDLEFCKLLESPRTNYTSLILSIVIPVLLFLLCIALYVFYKYRRSPACMDMSRTHLLFSRYDKEADL